MELKIVCFLNFVLFFFNNVQGYQNNQENCNAKKVEDTCTKKGFHYTYDIRSSQCVQFWGCSGSSNNFATLDECQMNCDSSYTSDDQTTEENCNAKKSEDPCTKKAFYYTYDIRSSQCVQFWGCSGNSNNFATLNECQTNCDSTYARDDQTKEDNCNDKKTQVVCSNKSFRYTYDVTAAQCVQFWGCEGYINNYATLQECQTKCNYANKQVNWSNSDRCQLPAVRGPCRSEMHRYYFNAATQRCETFIYGGCQGNNNNFYSLTDCQNACQYNVRDICQLGNDPGPCYNRRQRYYFNSATRRCEIFMYGGCLGNRNNFNSLLECHTACEPTNNGNNPCATGSPLVDSFGRWQSCSFDITGQVCPFTHQCTNYMYNQKICCPKQSIDIYPPITWPIPHSDICSLPKASGNCRTPSTKFYYNSYTRTCETFTYTGCQGNKNNFNTKGECEAQCGYTGGMTNPCEYGTPLLDQRTGLEFQCGICPWQYTCNTRIADRPGVCCPQFINNPVVIHVNPCSTGSPLIDPMTNEEQTCGFGISCPITHECNTKIADRAAVCCPKSFLNTGK